MAAISRQRIRHRKFAVIAVLGVMISSLNLAPGHAATARAAGNGPSPQAPPAPMPGNHFGVTLHLDAIQTSPSARGPLTTQAVLFNGSPYPVSYQTGCGVAPALYAHAHGSRAVYQARAHFQPTPGKSNDCLTQTVVVPPRSSQSLTSGYDLAGYPVPGAQAGKPIPAGQYDVQERLTYTVLTGDPASRYRRASDGSLIDTFPTTWTVSNSLTTDTGSGTATTPPTSSGSSIGPFSPKVLVIDYNTTGTPDDGSAALTNALVSGLTTGSRYHGASVSSAPFQISQTIEVTGPPPLLATPGAFGMNGDYQTVFNTYDICNLAATQGVNFVWLWLNGDGSSGNWPEWVTTGPTFQQTYGTNVPTCANTVTFEVLNYTRQVGEAIHSTGHYMENVLEYAFGPGDYSGPGGTSMYDLFDGQLWRYAGSNYQGEAVNVLTAGCGDVHFPPNAQHDYQYSQTNVVLSRCATYNPGNLGNASYQPVSVSTWRNIPCDSSQAPASFDCDEESFLMWWMQNMPGLNNTDQDCGGNPMPNWWQYIVALDTVTTTTVNDCTARLSPSGWLQQASGAIAGPTGISCPSVVQCFVGTLSGSVYATTDGGSTWNSGMSATSQSLLGISCPSSSTCFAVGRHATVVYSADGGATWTNQLNPLSSWCGGCLDLHGVACPTTTTCYAVGDSGSILITTDAGTTWSLRSVSNSDLEAISCASVTTCYAVGRLGTIVQTADGGTTWNYQTGVGGDLFGIACPGTTTCYAVGVNGTVLVTRNRGATWINDDSGTASSLAAVACTDLFSCYAVGDAGTVLSRTVSGWGVQSTGVSDNLGAVVCFGQGACEIAGGTGTILSSTNCGGTSTWTICLSADHSVVSPQGTATLAARVSQDVAGSGYQLDIIDKTAGRIVATCTAGTTCAGTDGYPSIGNHVYVARLESPFQAQSAPLIVRYTTVSAGWNLLGVPDSNLNSFSALAASLDQSLGSSTAISVLATYNNGRFTLYVPGFSADHALSPAQGVFALSSRAGVWAPATYSYNSGQTASLQPGWNLAAAPYPFGGLTTGAIENQIVASGGAVQEIVLYGSGGYRLWLPGQPSLPVSQTSGMWILTTTPALWTPGVRSPKCATGSAWVVCLASDSQITQAGSSITLTATSDLDVSALSYTLDVIDAISGQVVASCTVGTTCTAHVSFSSPTAESYEARIESPTPVVTPQLLVTWMGGGGSPPAAPSTPQASASDSTDITLSWTENGSNVNGFLIYDGSNYIDTVAANETSYTVSGIRPGSYHCFDLYAYNQYGNSAWSGWGCTTTPGS